MRPSPQGLSGAPVQQNFYWSDKDRKHYLEDIKDVLKPYIEAEYKQSESEVTNE